MGCLIRDIVALRDEGEQRLIGTGKGKKYLVRSRTPPGAVDDLHLRRLQKVIVPQQEVDVLDAEIDRKNSARRGGIVSKSVVRLVEPEERRFPNPIADATVEQGRPQRLARRHVWAAKCDAMQSDDTGVARREMAPARMERPQERVRSCCRRDRENSPARARSALRMLARCQ